MPDQIPCECGGVEHCPYLQDLLKQAEAELAKSEQRRSQLQLAVSFAHLALSLMREERDTAEAEVERLRRYATHMNYCASRNTGRESPVEANADCNCGLLEKQDA